MFGRLVLAFFSNFLGDFKMASRRSLLTVIVSLFLFTSFASAATAVPAASSEHPFPYIAEITGTDVYVRSGPGLSNYFCSKLSAPARVAVTGEKFGWLKIVPPPASFSWISKDFIKINPDDKTIGIVTSGNVRVWAGSENIDPMRSSGLQGRLSEGATVKLIGQEKGDYYKIVPPVGASLWVHKKYTRYIGQVPKPQPVVLPPKPKAGSQRQTPPANIDKSKQPASPAAPLVPEVKKAAPAPRPKPEIKPAPKKVVPPAEVKRLTEYKQITKLIDTELAKPLDTQNYDKMKNGLKMIIDDPKAGKAKKFAQYQLDNISRYELAQEVTGMLAQQDNDLTKALAMIRAGRNAAVAKIKDPGKFIVTGLFKASQIYTPQSGDQRYYIENEEGKIICYALPASESKVVPGEFVGKKVGLKGTVLNDPQNPIALISFYGIAEIKEPTQ